MGTAALDSSNHHVGTAALGCPVEQSSTAPAPLPNAGSTVEERR
ncbi:MAG: hypothetical protein ABSB39_22590 [Candidatus Sulfotelmatobacter sp.]